MTDKVYQTKINKKQKRRNQAQNETNSSRTQRQLSGVMAPAGLDHRLAGSQVWKQTHQQRSSVSGREKSTRPRPKQVSDSLRAASDTRVVEPENDLTRAVTHDSSF